MVDLNVEFSVVECCVCHCLFAMTYKMNTELHRNHEDFHCPMGHIQHYTSKSDIEKEREETQKATKEADRLRGCLAHKKEVIRVKDYQVRHYKGEVTKLKKKVAK